VSDTAQVELRSGRVVSPWLEAMGFPREEATRALEATGGSLDRAVEWLLSPPEARSPAPQLAASQSSLNGGGGGGVSATAGLPAVGTPVAGRAWQTFLSASSGAILFNKRGRGGQSNGVAAIARHMTRSVPTQDASGRHACGRRGGPYLSPYAAATPRWRQSR
jgi:hypothetical protein